MRLMFKTLALCIATLIGTVPASAGAIQSPATAAAVDTSSGDTVLQVRRRGFSFGYGYGYGVPYYGYYSYRPSYYYQPYAYYYPAPRYYGYYYEPRHRYYKHKRKYRDWDDDDWDD